MSETVAILGASDDVETYSYQAIGSLEEQGHKVVPVNPRYEQIDGTPCYKSLSDYQGGIDTVTIYVAPKILINLIPEIIAAKPKRAIFNPGTEDEAAIGEFEKQGILIQKACTLKLLKRNQFDEYAIPTLVSKV